MMPNSDPSASCAGVRNIAIYCTRPVGWRIVPDVEQIQFALMLPPFSRGVVSRSALARAFRGESGLRAPQLGSEPFRIA